MLGHLTLRIILSCEIQVWTAKKLWKSLPTLFPHRLTATRLEMCLAIWGTPLEIGHFPMVYGGRLFLDRRYAETQVSLRD